MRDLSREAHRSSRTDASGDRGVSKLAPGELAPLLGVMMVADITNDAKLGDETRPRIRQLGPTYADSAAESHAKIIRSHPPTKPVTPET